MKLIHWPCPPRTLLSDATITATGNWNLSEDKSSYNLQTTRLNTVTPQKITLVLADDEALKSTIGNGSYFTPSSVLLWYGKLQEVSEGKQEVVLRYRLPTYTTNGNNVTCDEGPWNTVSIYGKPVAL
eukprot:TRINITY_DN1994_c0_g1_i2.p1 TRINITY_DN1994_c0_g1~~TRINITY_DN1994_c0_g1_i2.p1  ORF type:complete len:146 (-),score=26.34 TRINITY_DN1994_c0_g1_i2:125-505(-)